MIQDIRQAVRMLVKSPGFTAIAVCSLAIGIGANSAIFSFADGLLLRPLPVRKPGRVVAVNPVTSGVFGASAALSYPDYLDVRDWNHTFEGVVGFGYASFGYGLDARNVPARKFGMYVTGNFFDTLGVQPTVGRGFRAGEDTAGGAAAVAVAVLSHDLWVSDFGASRRAIGSRVRLNGIDFTVVGVAPEQFTGMSQFIRPALYVPVAIWPRLNSGNILPQREVRWLTVKARLKNGVTAAQAQGDIEAISKRLRQMYPQPDRDLKLRIESELQLRTEEDPPDAALLEMMMGLAFCVLLVACANVAGLLLSRSRARVREIAVRLAIGAARWQLIRQLLVENLLLALLGGGLGTLLASAGVEFLGKLPSPTDLPIGIHVELDQRALLFALVLSVLSTFLFGLAPAIRSSRADVISALKARDGSPSAQQRLWGRKILVSGQVALSVVLLLVSAVLLKDFRYLLAGGPGYRVEQLLLASFDPGLLHYSEAQAEQFYRQLLEAERQAPGVRSASLSSRVPMSMGGSNLGFVPEGYSLPRGISALNAFDTVVGDGYFDTMRIGLLRGRQFLPSDKASTPRVAVVNEHFAAHYWPGQNPLGKRFHLTNATGPLVEVVGIARMSKYIWIAEPPLDFVYLPFAQNPQSGMTLISEARSPDAMSLAPGLRSVVHQLDPNMPVFDMRTMEDIYTKRAIKTSNVVLDCVTAMGLLGLALAMIGLYGLVAYSVSRRTREIGIRMAVGADRRSVLGMVIRQGLTLGVAGVLAGTALGILACRLLTAVIASTGGFNVTLFAAVSAALLGITLLAAYAPARRAAGIDPMRALREE